MRRREFIGLLSSAAATWPFAAHAQQSAMPVVGLLSGLAVSDRPILLAAFRQGLALAGYVEGRNVAVEYRYADNQVDRLKSQAADLIVRRVAVIVATGGNNSGLTAKSLTSTIPIVFISGFDPMTAGLVTSLSRPEGNVTGISFFSVEAGQKIVELMRELVPRATLVALILNRNNPEAAVFESSVRVAAQAFGLPLLVLDGRTVDEIDDAFAKLAQRRVSGVIVGADPFLAGRRHQIVALAAKHAVPAVYSNREAVEAGGLVSYGNSVADAYRRAGIYTGRILQGAKPADLPIERATKFELVINMRTAKALGLDVPLSLQMRIDEVIE